MLVKCYFMAYNNKINHLLVLIIFRTVCVFICHFLYYAIEVFIPQVEYLPVIFPSQKKNESASEFAERVGIFFISL